MFILIRVNSEAEIFAHMSHPAYRLQDSLMADSRARCDRQAANSVPTPPILFRSISCPALMIVSHQLERNSRRPGCSKPSVMPEFGKKHGLPD